MKISDHVENFNRLKNEGRCLHYESSDRCNEIIKAHSIQRSGQLAKIVEDGHVIHLDSSITKVRANNYRPVANKISWKKVTTFNGFCKDHDDKVFKPIDDYPLEPNEKQIMLYAYRCLCREYFVKENAVNLTKQYVQELPDESGILESLLIGENYGFQNLCAHKKAFDKSLSNEAYHDMRYVCFFSKSDWTSQYSGVLYPDFDFLGNQLQDLGNLNKSLDFISFFTAPMKNGWGFVFAWHHTSSETCDVLMSSLAEYQKKGGDISEAIFRFATSCCENHAHKISWWSNLDENQESEIIEKTFLMIRSDKPVPPDYLQFGLEGIVDWGFEGVYSNLQAVT